MSSKTVKYFVDPRTGVFLGAFEGGQPPAGSIEVSELPTDGRLTWDGSKWNEPSELKDQFVQEKRRQAYDIGDGTLVATDTARIDAIWDFLSGDRAVFDKIEAFRQKVKLEIPSVAAEALDAETPKE